MIHWLVYVENDNSFISNMTLSENLKDALRKLAQISADVMEEVDRQKSRLKEEAKKRKKYPLATAV